MNNDKTKHRCFIKVVILAFLGVSVPSLAGVFAPSWRGEARSVYAEWDSWNYRATYPGDFIFTPDSTGFGSGARTSILPRAYQFSLPISGRSPEILSDYNNRQGVLKLNWEGLSVNLPNFLEGERTRVRFEICYEDTYSLFAGFKVWGLTGTGALPGYDGVLINPNPIQSVRDGGWVTQVYEFAIDPNPLWETVEILFSSYPPTTEWHKGPYMDYFSFDTICVPEPASVLLIVLGTVLIRKSSR